MTIDRRTAIDDLPQLLRVSEVASFLDVSQGLVYELIRSGELPAVWLGRLVRVDRNALAVLTVPKTPELSVVAADRRRR